MRLNRVTKEEYELDDGLIFEIDPPPLFMAGAAEKRNES